MNKYAVTFTFEADNDEHAKKLGSAANVALYAILLEGEDREKAHRRAGGRFKFDSIERADYDVPHWRKVV